MFLHLTVVSIDNQWLSSFMFELDKINLNDIIFDDECIKTWKLEYACLIFSSIDTNSKASYKT